MLLPEHLVEPVIKHLHEATNYGRDSLTIYVKLWLTGPGISKALRKVIAGCVVCQKNNPRAGSHNTKDSAHLTLLRCQGSESGNIC